MNWDSPILQEVSSLSSSFLALQSFSVKSIMLSQSEKESSLYSRSRAVNTASPDDRKRDSILAIISTTVLRFLTALRPL